MRKSGLGLIVGLFMLGVVGNAKAGPAADRCDVLLVTDESLVEAWQAFAEFKTSIGLRTKIAAVQDIASGYKGVDIQAKIRACSLDHIENHSARYIILGGDSLPNGKGLVPDRDTLHIPMPRFGYKDIPTDLYYLSPGEYDWDANGDGVYGDWANDREAIRYTHPSGASIGRIPVRTVGDVKAYTDKVIAYETRYPKGEFAKKMMYTNTVNHSEPKVRRSWDDYISKAWEGGQAYRFFHTQTEWDEIENGDYALKADNWVEQINRRTVGKMHMHGHGMPGYWVLEHETGDTKCDARVVEKLQNKDAYLVMTTVSCFTGMFDAPFDPTITESMLRTPGKGAVVVVCPSREGVPMFHNPQLDMRLMVTQGKLDGTTESMTRFWVNGLSPREDGTYRTIGEAFHAMKLQMTEHAERTAGYHWCQSELNLLGDPTLSFRAKEPVDPDPNVVSILPVVGSGARQITISTTLRGTHGARLCVWEQGGGYVVVPVDERGRATALIGNADGEVTYAIAGPTVNAVIRKLER